MPRTTDTHQVTADGSSTNSAGDGIEAGVGRSQDGWDQGCTWAFAFARQCVQRGSRGNRALSQFLWQGPGTGTVRLCGLRQAPSWVRAAVPGAGTPLRCSPPG